MRLRTLRSGIVLLALVAISGIGSHFIDQSVSGYLSDHRHVIEAMHREPYSIDRWVGAFTCEADCGGDGGLSLFGVLASAQGAIVVAGAALVGARRGRPPGLSVQRR